MEVAKPLRMGDRHSIVNPTALCSRNNPSALPGALVALLQPLFNHQEPSVSLKPGNYLFSRCQLLLSHVLQASNPEIAGVICDP